MRSDRQFDLVETLQVKPFILSSFYPFPLDFGAPIATVTPRMVDRQSSYWDYSSGSCLFLPETKQHEKRSRGETCGPRPVDPDAGFAALFLSFSRRACSPCSGDPHGGQARRLNARSPHPLTLLGNSLWWQATEVRLSASRGGYWGFVEVWFSPPVCEYK